MKHLKTFESSDFDRFGIGLEPMLIATNESYWSWEDDTVIVNAYIYVDLLTDELTLKIKRTRAKHGLGAGKWTNELVDVNVGNIIKPKLSEIRKYLTKHKYSADRTFKRQWIDKDDQSKALSTIIKDYIEEYSPELVPKKRNYKHKPEVKKDIEILDYSDRSFAIFGDTRNIKDKLKNLRGRYNRFLTHPGTKEKTPGWIFPKTRKELVEKEIENISENLDTDEILSDFDYYIKEFGERFAIDKFYVIFDDFKKKILEECPDPYYEESMDDSDEYNLCEAFQIYINDYNSKNVFIKFLNSYVIDREFELGKYGYESLEENSRCIYDYIEKEGEYIFKSLILNKLDSKRFGL